jgi:folate-binding protein YgfZ
MANRLPHGTPADEYRAARNAVGLVDRRDWGILELTGRDRATFLHALLSNEIKALTPGQGCAATLLDVHGKVQVVVSVWVADDRIFVVTPPSMAQKTAEALDHYLFSEKVAIRDLSDETALLVLVGPKAHETAERVAGARPGEAAWSHVTGMLGEAAVRLVSGGRETGEAEVWVAGPSGEATRLWDALVAAGARPIGRAAFESLRIEAGTPALGRDVDESVLLPEIPFASLVSQTKGCYPGQEVVVRIRDRGHVNRMLVGLLVDATASDGAQAAADGAETPSDGAWAPSDGAEVLAESAGVGRVTSSTWSFGLERPIALAFVRRQHAAAGSRVEVRVGERTLPASVSELPFAR